MNGMRQPYAITASGDITAFTIAPAAEPSSVPANAPTGPQLPIHPRRPGGAYPSGDLSGAGVAFNTSWANVNITDAKYLVMYAKATPNGGTTTYRYTLIWSNEDSGTGTEGSYTTMWTSPAVLEADLDVGAQIANIDVPRPVPGQALPRFLRLSFVSSGTHTSGAVQACIVIDRFDQVRGATLTARPPPGRSRRPGRPTERGMSAPAHTIVFTPSGRRGEVPDGASVLDAARALGVDLDSVCGGRGICGRLVRGCLAPVNLSARVVGQSRVLGRRLHVDRVEALPRVAPHEPICIDDIEHILASGIVQLARFAAGRFECAERF
jgi:hypothetical protein